jgi:predicted glycogen debranching enzyme
MNRLPDTPGAGLPTVIDFGREVCCDLSVAERREWLVTNGIGGYGFGTIAGQQTRSYHALLCAALNPPSGRTILLSKLDETARYNSEDFQLFTNRWKGGSVEPAGYLHIERFHLEGTTPVWTFALADALIEKRVFLQSGANTTYILYKLLRASAPVELRIKALTDYCGEHCVTIGRYDPMQVTLIERGLRVVAFEGAVPLYLLSDAASACPESEWYRNFDLAVERERGLPDRADHFCAGDFHATLSPGESLTIVASTDRAASTNGQMALDQRQGESRALLGRFASANTVLAQAAPPAVKQLVLAADQFIAARPLEKASDAKTILAGYPWFSDWGRDTTIALPGLCLVTGRPWLARNILRSYAQFVSEGMLPNRLPGPGEAPAYNSVDAALWYFEAIRQYFDATGDIALLHELYPVLAEIIEAHVRGTRYQIHVDEADGLLYAGEPGVQLTWMDAKVGDHVITPRIGKPVEVNALWFNAAASMAKFARALGRIASRYDTVIARVRASFAKFWNSKTTYCYDVIGSPDVPAGFDAALRPNQIFAVSLPETALSAEQQRSVVDVCARELLTSFGLRSLGRGEPGYHGHYGGDQTDRDAAYHQGTVWGWLLGPFVLAHLRVYRNPDLARTFLEPMLQQIHAAGVGTLSEIFDGDPPFTPNGCIAQAWTVGETLRAWRATMSWKDKESGTP